MRIAVIGAGFGGLAAACYLAKSGHEVHVYEKNEAAGGRAQVCKKKGFTFNLGPSWYMMPDVFEEFFADFDKKPSDYYQLEQLAPSYRTYFPNDEYLDIHSAPKIYKEFERLEKGAGERLTKYLERVQYEYAQARKHLLSQDGLNIRQFASPSSLELLSDPVLIGSYHQRIRNVVKDERLRKVLEFLTVFLGGSPQTIPALYGMLNWADMGLGIWHPKGGFESVVNAFVTLAEELGVTFHYETPVEYIKTNGGKIATHIVVKGIEREYDTVVANADYSYVETKLLNEQVRTYGQRYWRDKTFSPSAVIGAVGLKKRLPLEHHSLFFDGPWKTHFDDVFKKHRIPNNPLFYACTPSRSDPNVAPKGQEALTIVVPVSNRAKITDEQCVHIIDGALKRIAEKTGVQITDNDIVVKKVFGPNYFKDEFNATHGNAFGLSHTFMQTGPLRPRLRSKKVRNLYYVGHCTNPGTGVPLVILGGKMVAGLIK